MKEIKFKHNLKCFSTRYEYNGNPHGCSIFAKTFEEAEEMLKQKKLTERISGEVVAEYCLNPYEIEEDNIKQFREALQKDL